MQELGVTGSAWCGLEWSSWVPFDGGDFRTITNGPGVYRVRITGESALAYIGQTGRSVRERLQALRSNTASELMPFDDPHTAAPSLWAWRDAKGFAYECSGAHASQDIRERQALECWLLWKHRVAEGRSTLCNHGQFHPDYVKSRARKSGQRGGRRAEVVEFTQHGPLSPTPLQQYAAATCPDWMGLQWSQWTPLSALFGISTVALYRIRALNGVDLLYIGESLSLANRMRAHAIALKGLEPLEASYVTLPQDISKCGMHELENDLLGGYYESMRTAPTLQFSYKRQMG